MIAIGDHIYWDLRQTGAPPNYREDIIAGTGRFVGLDPSAATAWPELLGRRPLSADAVHVFRGDDLAARGPVSHVRLNIYPDGGISRVRLWGRPAGPPT